MTKRTALTLPALLIATATTLASPVMPGNRKIITLTDGTTVTAEQYGDEFMSWWETDDGRRYVESTDDSNVYTPADFEAMCRHAQVMRAPLAEKQNTIQAKYTGRKKGLIVLVEFADRKFSTNHNRNYYEKVANETGFTNDEGYIGSVRDYFLAQSNGIFELTFDVVGPVSVSKGYAHYGANSGQDKDTNVGEMLSEATNMIASQVDFGDYDWDGDGTADQVFYLYAGLGENAGGNTNTIWAHTYYMRGRGGILKYATGNVDRYACASELAGVMNNNGEYTGDTRPTGIGTICHEFSHCLGLPDTYDTNGQKQYGMGYYDLLAMGNYLGNGMTPPNFTAWERIDIGWVEPIELNRAATVEGMASSSDYGRPFIIYSDNNPDEYYLLENRQRTGWDCKLYGHGLMITHVDYDKRRWTSNKVNASGQDHQRCTIFHADNDDVQNRASAIRGDLYPYTGKNSDNTTYVNNSLTDSSTPAATLWNSHDSSLGTTFMGKPITEITQNEDGTVSFLVMGGDDNNVVHNSTTDGIKNVNVSRSTDNTTYTLDGRRVDADYFTLPKGIYIIGGKKVVK